MYAGMTLLGVLGFVEGVLMLGLLFSLLLALGVVAPGTAEGGRPVQAEEFWGATVFLAILVALYKGLEYIHCRRVIQSFVPLKRL